jgi:hypothetical protein
MELNLHLSDEIKLEEELNLELTKQWEMMQYAEDAANLDAIYYGEQK